MLEALTARVVDEWASRLRNGFEADARMQIRPDAKTPYKGGVARFDQDRWVANSTSWSDSSLADLMNALSFRATDSETYNADEFDAALCAVVGCFPEDCRMQDDALRQVIRERLDEAAETVRAMIWCH